MKIIIIKQSVKPGRDSQTFRAYAPGVNGRPDQPLGISASTTGNLDFGVRRCAAKAFIKFTEPQADPDEIETRILITRIAQADIWMASLQGNDKLRDGATERRPSSQET